MVCQKFTGAGNLPAVKSPDFRTPPSPPAVWGLMQVTSSSAWLQRCLPPPQLADRGHTDDSLSHGSPAPPLTSNSCLNYTVEDRTPWIPSSRHRLGNLTPRKSDSFYFSPQLRVQLYKSWHLATKAEMFLSRQNQIPKSSS